MRESRASRWPAPANPKVRSRATPFWLCVLLAAVPLTAQVDPFYDNLLRDGVAAQARGDLEGAAKRLRIAAFGMLDAPLRLADTLVRLGVTQAALDRRDAFQNTFDRIIELEELYGAYSRATIDERLRSEFENRALQWIPATSLRASATFGPLVRRKQLLHVQGLASAARRAELERLAAENPDDVAWRYMLAVAQVEDGDGREAIEGIERVLVDLPDNASALCLRGRANLQAERCQEASVDVPRCDVRSLPPAELGRYIDCLTEAERWLEAASVVVSLPPEIKAQRPIARREKKIARALPPETEIDLLPEFSDRGSADDVLAAAASAGQAPRVAPTAPIAPAIPQDRLADLRRRQQAARTVEELGALAQEAARLADEFPTAREPLFIAGEAAYRASDWRAAADYLRRAGEPGADRPDLLFYLAVALFELGDQNEAARVLRKAEPYLRRTAIVERYLRSVLGEGP